MLTIYKSSAGSGKTYTLVKEYLKLLVRNPNHFKNILAVTFTNKATAEMKERVISKLAEVSSSGDENFIALLETETGITKELIVANAQLALQNILHNYSDFTIQTIDSFFNKTVRSLARELGLPLQFDVEMNQSFVIDYIVDSLMAEIGNDALLAKHLETFALKKTDDDKGWNIESELKTIAAELFKEKFQQHVTDKEVVLYDEEVLQYVNKQIALFENTLIKYSETFFAVLDEHVLTEEDFHKKKLGIYSFFKKLRNANYDKNKTAEDTLNGDIPWANKQSSNKNLVEQLTQSVFAKLLEEIISYAGKNSKTYFTCVAISKLQYVAVLVQYLEEQLKKYRKENDVVMISDINRIVKKFISLSEAPFIYEKNANHFRFYLIDEFQDTSDFQWNNFLPLIENALSEGNETFVVGDVKQSIYRFRGGNMKLLYKNIRKDLKHFSENIIEESLNTNYRSKSTVVNFNNMLFSNMPALLAGQMNSEMSTLLNSVYSINEVHQHVATKNSAEGFVHIEFIDSKNLPYKNKDGDDLQWKEIALQKLVETIRNLETKNYRLGDIAILTRSNFDGVMIAEHLFKNNYREIITSDSLSLSSAVQINLLINTFRYVHDQHNEVAKIALLHDYVHIHQTQTDWVDAKIFMEQRIDSDENFPFTKDELIRMRQLNIYQLAEVLVAKFILNKKPDAYIQRFFELLMELSDKNIYTVAGFLEWWEENSHTEACSVITPENANAIRIMTIHKSKGLQFPIVIMPFAEWSLSPRPNNLLWVSTDEKPFDKVQAYPVTINKSLADSYFAEEYETEVSETIMDNINMMYVAFTRAEKQLYAFASFKDFKNEIKNTGHLMHSLITSVPDWETNFSDHVLQLGNCLENINTLTEKISNTNQLQKMMYNNWNEKIYVRTTTDENLWSKKIPEKTDYGNIIHKTFSNIVVRDDFENAVVNTISTFQLSSKEESVLREKISGILSHPETNEWWNGWYEIKTEATFILPDGTQHRPDRVMIKNKEAIIVDYKTGEQDNSHKKQIDVYADALMQMGYDVTKKVLLYVDRMELVEV